MSFFDKLFSYIVCDMDLLCDLDKLLVILYLTWISYVSFFDKLFSYIVCDMD